MGHTSDMRRKLQPPPQQHIGAPAPAAEMAALALCSPAPLVRPGAACCPRAFPGGRCRWLTWYQMVLETGLSQRGSFRAGALGQLRGEPHTQAPLQVPGPGGHANRLLLSMQGPHPLGREHLLPRDVLQVGPRLTRLPPTHCVCF